MKKLYISLAAILLSGAAFAQASFNVTGAKTIENLDASGPHFTFYNITTGQIVPLSDSATANWDIAFRSTTILTNSGTSGPGTVQSQVVASDFAALTTAPSNGYKSDAVTGKAITTGSGNGWYNYDGATNIISPLAGRTIAVQLATGGFAKVQILSYYKDNNTAGTARFYTFRITKSTTNVLGTTITSVQNLKADLTHYQFFNLAKADTIAAADSVAGTWDIAFRGTTIIFNSGVSGAGKDSAQIVFNSFDAITNAPAKGWIVDGTAKAVPTGSDNGWYHYDGDLHVISTIATRTILIKTATGKYAKLKVLSYYKDANSANASRYYSFVYEYQPDGSNVLKATESNVTTGVEETVLAGNTVSVYPNPVASSGTLKFSGAVTLVKLFNAQGAEVLTAVPSSNELTLHVEPGFYTIQLSTAGSAKNEKIIIQ